MELRHLRYFLAVAEELHYGRAAARLNIGQPVLSRQIMRLEDELGTALFQRSRRGVRTTPAGLALVAEARSVLKAAERAIAVAQRVGRGKIGQLNVGFVPSAHRFGLSAIMARFRALSPEVEVMMNERCADDQEQEMREARQHVGFTYAPVQDPSFSSLELGRERLLICLPRRWGLGVGGDISLASLVNRPLILFHREHGPSLFDRLKRVFLSGGLAFQPTLFATEPRNVMALAASGSGFGFIPESVAPSAPSETLIVRTAERLPELPVALVWPRETADAATQSLVSIARDILGSRVAA